MRNVLPVLLFLRLSAFPAYIRISRSGGTSPNPSAEVCSPHAVARFAARRIAALLRCCSVPEDN